LAEWPGVHCGPTLLSGAPLEGVWHDRTREYLARLKGDEISPEDFVQPETLTFQALPCWDHLSRETYQARIAALVEEIEGEADAERERSGRPPLGAEAIRRQNPTTQPNQIKKSPAPRFHAFTKRTRKELYQAYSWFVAGFREAAEKLRQGDRNAQFPQGCFPPHLPFVREAPPPLLPQPA
jgi:hypothetical protein